MIGQITANELKVKGITGIDELIADNDGVVVTVRGIGKYVILPIDEYNQLRELELDAAIQESKNDIKAGRVFSGTIEEHIKRVTHV
ncbi:MAG TPA: prevent-host-death protein [Treponemataceae bacterium]|nr:prevent-host-death protein [Treponemataceae bacterium]